MIKFWKTPAGPCPAPTYLPTVPTPASAGSRQAAEPKSLCVPHFLLASKNLKRDLRYSYLPYLWETKKKSPDG